MIDEGDIQSIRCNISPRGTKSVRKADGLNLCWFLCSSACTNSQWHWDFAAAYRAMISGWWLWSTSDFSTGHITWGVASQILTFVSHSSSAFLRVIRLMVLVTQLTAVSHCGSRVTCHSFLNLHLCFSRLCKQGRSLFWSESVSLLFGNLHAKAIKRVQSRAALSTSS